MQLMENIQFDDIVAWITGNRHGFVYKLCRGSAWYTAYADFRDKALDGTFELLSGVAETYSHINHPTVHCAPEWVDLDTLCVRARNHL
jgi:hypothetical protein